MGANKQNTEFNPSSGESSISATIRMYGGEIEAGGMYRVKVRPFILLLPNSTVLENKEEITHKNSTVISSKQSIVLDFTPIDIPDMLEKYPGKSSQYDIDQTTFQDYRTEMECCQANCEISCEASIEVDPPDVTPGDYTKKEHTLEKWVAIYCVVDENGVVTLDTIHGVDAPLGAAIKPSVSHLSDIKGIVIGDFKLRQHDSIINKDNIDYTRRYSETIEETQELVSPNKGTISNDIKKWSSSDRYMALSKLQDGTGMEVYGEDYVQFQSNTSVPRKTQTINKVLHPTDKCGVAPGTTYTFDDPENRKGMLMYYDGFAGGERGFVVSGVYDSTLGLTCSSEDWGIFTLTDGCSDACQIGCQTSCQLACELCQITCECGHEYIAGGRDYTVDPNYPLNLDTCIDCDTSTDLTSGTYEFTPCPTTSDVIVTGVCESSCETITCPTSYQNPCVVGCEVSCECSREIVGTTCYACDSGNEGGHTPIGTDCESGCEHGESCSTSGQTQNCDCMCNTLAENSCQVPAQTSCGSCETSCQTCDICQTCQVCDGGETPICIPIASCNITWDGVNTLGEEALFDSHYNPSSATTPISYSWSIENGSGSIRHRTNHRCWITWTGATSSTIVKVVITNACSTKTYIINVGETGVCVSPVSVRLNPARTYVCSSDQNKNVEIEAIVTPSSGITNLLYRWYVTGQGWTNWLSGNPGSITRAIYKNTTVEIQVKADGCSTATQSDDTRISYESAADITDCRIEFLEAVGSLYPTYCFGAIFDTSKFVCTWNRGPTIKGKCGISVTASATFTPKAGVCVDGTTHTSTATGVTPCGGGPTGEPK